MSIDHATQQHENDKYVRVYIPALQYKDVAKRKDREWSVHGSTSVLQNNYKHWMNN